MLRQRGVSRNCEFAFTTAMPLLILLTTSAKRMLGWSFPAIAGGSARVLLCASVEVGYVRLRQ